MAENGIRNLQEVIPSVRNLLPQEPEAVKEIEMIKEPKVLKEPEVVKKPREAKVIEESSIASCFED